MLHLREKYYKPFEQKIYPLYKLTENGKDKRVYVNSVTGSRCAQSLVYTDKDGNQWWSFEDLLTLPYTRNFAATKISSLYSLGLSKDDLNNHITGLKNILNSDDKEKFQKAYALVLDFESKATSATDAIKQMTSLVCVYFTINDEPIDSFDNNLQIKKMSLLEADPAMHTFFLNRQIDLTGQYMTALNLISQIALPPQNELLQVSKKKSRRQPIQKGV